MCAIKHVKLAFTCTVLCVTATCVGAIQVRDNAKEKRGGGKQVPVPVVRPDRCITRAQRTDHAVADTLTALQTTASCADARLKDLPEGGSSVLSFPRHLDPRYSHDPFDSKDQTLKEQWASFHSNYALTADVESAGWVSGNSYRMKRLAKKLETNRTIRIMSFGSSFTRGHGCMETTYQSELECAWPTRLEQWWRKAFPDSDMVLSNRAEHGANPATVLSGIGAVVAAMDEHPDLVIVDYLVSDITDNAVEFESLIRSLRTLLPETQMLIFNDACETCIERAPLRRRIAEHYEIPMVDYAAMVAHERSTRPPGFSQERLWPSSTSVPPMEATGTFTQMKAAWKDFEPTVYVFGMTAEPINHPPWPVHQYVADAIGNAILRMLADVCGNKELKRDEDLAQKKPVNSQEDLDKLPVCLHPLTYFSAAEEICSTPARNTSYPFLMNAKGGWELKEDVKDRPGWIATKAGATISFPVRFGMHPTLTITYLRSYAGVGNAEATLVHSNTGLQAAGALKHVLSTHSKFANARDAVSYVDEPRTLKGANDGDSNFSLPYTEHFIDRPDGLNGGLIALAVSNDEKMDMEEVWKAASEQNIKASIDDLYYESTIRIETVDDSKFKLYSVISC
eukprot:TRINITY_DN14130_c0_g1_i1.p1 TRINITY_DN14130_c0_g1~~TRINITY_DN14130_c0_g1_i1.p1  ORF type:complete len:623 (-),score=66.71 TRINITY_DN14130_c0_g1_i1:3-1871(-)